MVVRVDGKTLLIDAPPELRLQVVRSHLTRMDALLFTHSHADHIFGLDDVRRYNDVLGGDLRSTPAAMCCKTWSGVPLRLCRNPGGRRQASWR